MRVDLGGADVGMTEQFLHGTQVTAGFQQVAGKGMAQHVWMYVLRQPLLDRPFLQTQLYPPRADPLAALAHEQGRLFCIGHLRTHLQPRLDGLDSVLAKR